MPSAAQALAQRFDRIPALPSHTKWAAVLSIGGFLDSFDSMILASGLPGIIPSLHIGYARVGLVISAAFFGMLIGAILFGWLSERYGRRTIYGAAVILFGIMSVVCAFAWDFNSLFCIRVIQGLGLGGAIPVAATISAECMPARSRGKAFGLSVGLLFVCGFVVAPLAGVAFNAMLGPAVAWRVMFLVGGLALPYGIVSYWLLPESPRWSASHGRLPQAVAVLEQLEAQARKLGRALFPAAEPRIWLQRATRIGEAFGSDYWRRTLLIWVAFFSTYFVTYGLGNWLPTLYTTIGGLPINKALTLTVITGAVQVVLGVVLALTVDRIGRVKLLKLGFSLSLLGIVVGALALGVFHASSWPVLFLSSIPMVAGNSINSGLVYLYAPELFPTRMRTLVTSTGSAAGRIGSIIAPILFGALLQANLGLVSVFIALGVVSVFGLVIGSAFGIETKQKSLEDIAQ